MNRAIRTREMTGTPACRALTLWLLAAGAVACAPAVAPPAAGSLTGAVPVGGARIGYQVEGSGQPCLVVGSRLHHSRVFSPRFKSHFRCAYVDARMFDEGAQPPPDRAYDLEVMVEDLEAVRRELGWDTVVVVGHSLFALTALQYARAHPERVVGVAMIAMSPVAPTEALMAEFIEADASPQRKAVHARQQQRWQEWLRERERTPNEAFLQFGLMNSALYWYDPEFDSRPLWEGVFWDAELFGSVWANSVEGYDLAAGSPVEVPVFVGIGRYDYRVPYTLWDERTKAALPRLTFHLFERSGHTPQYEEPDAFDDAVVRWLRDSVQGAPASAPPSEGYVEVEEGIRLRHWTAGGGPTRWW